MSNIVNYFKRNFLGLAFLLLSAAFFCFWLYLNAPISNDYFKYSESIKILDKNNKLLFEILSSEEEKREDVSLEKVSDYFIKAIIITEDKRFFKHRGIDYKSIIRALFDNYKAGRIVSGASTITQQLARNILQKNCDEKDCELRNIKNKIKESIFALRLEKQFSKEKIVEMYINRISFGGVFIGINSASKGIFNKSSKNLDLAESAFLAGLIQSPSRFSPFENFIEGKKRQEFALRNMFSNSVISNEEFQDALVEELVINEKKQKLLAPHFVFYLLNNQKIDLKKPTSIKTTIDLGLQMQVEKLVNSHLEKIGKKNNISNAAVLIAEVKTGNILAYLGSRDYANNEIDGQVDMLTSSRQVGSTLKPFLYLLSFLELGWNANTKIIDEPISFTTSIGTPWEPQNYDLQYRGEVSAREALAQSLNVPATKTLEQIGADKFINFLKRFNVPLVNPDDDFGLSSALGTPEIKLINLAGAYGILARKGEDFHFNILENTEIISDNSQIAPKEKVLEIVDILSDHAARIEAFGEDSSLDFNFPVAAKTGTTRNFKDNYTIGFTPEILVFVWVGNADGSPMQNVSGITGAGTIFNKIMNLANDYKCKNQSYKCEIDFEKTNISISDNQQNLINSNNNFRIISPVNNARFQLSATRPLESQKIKFSASDECEWFVDDLKIGEAKEILWIPKRGNYKISAKYKNKEVFKKIFVE